MGRITILRVKLLVSGLHALILLGPLALIGLTCEKIAIGANWISDQLDTVCGIGGKFLLPKWWPSHRILRALQIENQKKRQKEVDRLHK